MRIRALQHVPFEGIGSMAEDFNRAGYSLETTHWYRGEEAPTIGSFDVLIVMGGPMGVYDETEFPWLIPEKALIRAAIDAGKIIIGICLGAQLIAAACGARVLKNPHREIGWFPLTIHADEDPVARALTGIDVFHWHGDAFDLPEGAVWLASSEACKHQAFRLGDNVYGFQFHLETTSASAAALIENCGNELDGSTYVQDAQAILGNTSGFANINRAMSAVLKNILSIR